MWPARSSRAAKGKLSYPGVKLVGPQRSISFSSPKIRGQGEDVPIPARSLPERLAQDLSSQAHKLVGLIGVPARSHTHIQRAAFRVVDP